MPMKRAALVAAVLLSACSDAGRAFVVSSVETYRQQNDIGARARLAAYCGMAFDAAIRTHSDQELQAAMVLCGGPAERPVTAKDVIALRDLLDLLGRERGLR